MKKLIYIAAFASFAFSTHAKPLKIYLLVGQSNMQGHAAERTLAHLGDGAVAEGDSKRGRIGEGA